MRVPRNAASFYPAEPLMNVQPSYCRLLLGLSLGLSFAACERARATTTTCIPDGDIAGLQAALSAAASNGDDDLIQLQIGHYSMPSAFVLDFPSAEAHSLTIEGGYSPNFGNACGMPPASPDARLTVLDRGLWKLHLATGAASITLRGLTLQNASSADATHAPIEIDADAAATGTIALENAMLIGNSSAGTSAIYFSAGQGAISVQNSLLASNVTLAPINPIRFRSVRNSSFCVSLVNSTFAGNVAAQPSVYVLHPNCLAIAANDIFWGNATSDVVFSNLAGAYLVSDDLSAPNDATGTQSFDILSANPVFDADFSIQASSPLRDRGNPGGVGSVFSPGLFDVTGQVRASPAGLPDIGAFENTDVILINGFELP
jgi:hypothetical protein